ncbi:hypothetical protein HNR62_000334 [Oceanisphaera litoralis]|uniref:hypothetical protein n=1 Tax=Oceanisphaera litoralis TaxID=225144 RepID=UPI0019599B19|nr:hypothetical protein [Oceanisphaera litoralis]MBM7454505.1 hypothetical protein [Oceanisphaera litoralis]
MTVYNLNGTKIAVEDTREMIATHTLKVGDRVRILEKPSYGDPKLHTGIIAGFEPFKDSPTLIIAYLEVGYNSAELKFVYLNALQDESKRFEVIPAFDDDLPLDKADVVELMNRNINKLEHDLDDAKRKKAYFLAKFGKVFGEVEQLIA